MLISAIGNGGMMQRCTIVSLILLAALKLHDIEDNLTYCWFRSPVSAA